MRALDLTGQRYGLLTCVMRQPNDANNKALWLCSCDCGGVKTTRTNDLRNGSTRSCGCLNLDHGHARNFNPTPEYQAWTNMKQRCYNPSHPGFDNWGGRGIAVCDTWFNSFLCFLADMGLKPEPHLSLDRIDNNGNYEPGNCRWADVPQQLSNRRPRRKRYG